jgi:DNA-binding CsgD family transcriptional regulator
MKSSPSEGPPEDLRWATFRVGGKLFGVLSVRDASDRVLPDLTAAEMDVADLIRKGHSNAVIASIRRTSVRTVANQIASIFRKLGVGSRVELAALLARRRG